MNRVSTRQNGNVTHCVEKKLQQLVDYVILSQTICRVGDSHLWPLCQAYMTQLVEQCSSLYERHNSMLWNSPQSKQDSYDALLFPHNYGSSPSVLNSNNHTFCSGKSSPRLLLTEIYRESWRKWFGPANTTFIAVILLLWNIVVEELALWTIVLPHTNSTLNTMLLHFFYIMARNVVAQARIHI